MANKYLDSAGLSHLWGNLKAFLSNNYVTREEFEALKTEMLNVGFAADETDMYTTYTEQAALVDELENRLDGGDA